MIKNKVLSVIFKSIIVLLGAFALLDTLNIFQGQIRISAFYFYTNLSNLMIVIYFIGALIYLLTPHSGRRVTWAPTFKHVCVIAILVTCLIAHFMLKMPLTINLLILHYIVPIMTLLDWILFDEKGSMKIYTPIVGCIPAYLYLLYTFIRMKIQNSTQYPYPFLDIQKLGMNNVVITVILLTVAFLLLGYIFYFVDHRIKTKERNYY